MESRVIVSVVMDGKDYEVFGSGEFARETIQNNDQPQHVVSMVLRWCDECLAELEIIGQQLNDGAVRLTGVFKFVEGSSGNSNLPDSLPELTMICPIGRTVRETWKAWNSRDYDDREVDGATAKITVTNSIF